MRFLHPGDRVTVHYAASNQSPDPKWRERPGVILTIASGKPKNVLVQTDIGKVVIPYGNCRISETVVSTIAKPTQRLSS